MLSGLNDTGRKWSFLDIPRNIRFSVYREAGLYENRLIHLNDKSDHYRDSMLYWVVYNEYWEHYTGDYGYVIKEFYTLCHNLLLVSRTIYLEVSSIVYSNNRVMVRYGGPNSLRGLLNLTPTVFGHLTHLTIGLFTKNCECGHDSCCVLGREYCENSFFHGVFDEGDFVEHAGLFDDWRAVVSKIVQYSSPQTLSLSLSCDVDDFAIAETILQPLTSLWGLKNCAIRLGTRPNRSLQLLAEKTSLRLTNGKPKTDRLETRAFAFKDLPVSLQWQILEYTDLVTPKCEVNWSLGHGYFLVQWGYCGYKKCNSYINDSICCCHRYHAAYSSSCKCWAPPTALFLVSREFHSAALTVFFSKNKFVLLPRPGYYETFPEYAEISTIVPNRIHPSYFLREVVPPSALYFLRSLEIVFPPFEDHYLSSNKKALSDWMLTIKYIKSKLNLCNLDLVVSMASPIWYRQGWADSTNYRSPMTKDRARKILETFWHLNGTFIPLRGLKNFFMHLDWPTEWDAVFNRHGQPEAIWLKLVKSIIFKRISLEKSLEQRIMGESYDSSARGKGFWSSGQWYSQYVWLSVWSGEGLRDLRKHFDPSLDGWGLERRAAAIS